MPTLLEQLRDAFRPAYEVERELGTGGMGSVFLARDPNLDRHVAIKILRPDLTSDVAPERFQREARVLAKLKHPNIVPVYHAGEVGGFSYYVMEYIEGETLEEHLGRGPLSEEQTLKLADQLLSALQAAHDNGVIHRDIKPSNIFLMGDAAVLVDFGIAKPVEDSPDKLTSTDQRIGTPGYMPPEQYLGDPVTPATDIYSAGVILYEAFTGRRWSVFRPMEEVDWSGIPTGLVPDMRRALAPVPSDRWPDASSFSQALLGSEGMAQSFRSAAPVRIAGTALVAAVYIGAAWAVLEVVDHAISRFLLPEWVHTASLVLLLAGVPVVLATAVLRSAWLPSARGPGDSTPLGDSDRGSSHTTLRRLASQLTWRRTIGAGILSLGGVGLTAALIVSTGGARVTEALGWARETLGDTFRIAVADFEAGANAEEIAEAAQLIILIDLQQLADLEVYGPEQLEMWMGPMNSSVPGVTGAERVLRAAREGGLGALLVGDVHMVGDQYVLSARVVAAENGRDLIAVRVATGRNRLFRALEQLSIEVRRRLGEVEEELRRTPSAAQVAGGFFEQLARAVEAEDLEALRALWLLTEDEIGNWAKFFEGVRDIDVRYTVNSTALSDSVLTVDVDGRYSFFNESTELSQTLSFVSRVRIYRREGQWVMKGVNPQEIRHDNRCLIWGSDGSCLRRIR